MASRRTQLMQLAKEASKTGDLDAYEILRGDIFREFNFDIGAMDNDNYAEGGVSLEFDEGEVAANMFRGGAGFKGHF